MKTIRIGNEIKRVSDSEAEERVKNQGYEYCPKNLWKTSVRNVAPKAPKVTQEDSSNQKRKERSLAVLKKEN